ncbi:hypothetical protein H0H92_004042 [Tricholoma furcatifolium]|nr:hypothetical protein H0H92_004042 [Tricholoma furcatifolium]
MFLLSAYRWLKLQVYFFLTTQAAHPSLRVFRFGIQWVMKMERRLHSTEADALRFLNSSGVDLPISRLVDSIPLNGTTYKIMTRLPDDLLWDQFTNLSDADLHAIAQDVHAVLQRLWLIQQSPADAGKVMLGASGHGLLSPSDFFDSYWGPGPSIQNLYWVMSGDLFLQSENPWTEEGMVATFPEQMRAVTADRIVWVHTDLRMLNILVRNGRLSGIIDWADSGWLPAHWQLHALRNIRVGYPKRICSVWENIMFPPETEAAYKASRKGELKIPSKA